jgi:uncharacterized repeat protein (TIGR01451 family)
VNGECTVTINSDVAGTFNAHAASNVMVGGLSLLRETDGLGDNSDVAVKTYVDDFNTIDPDGVNPVGDPHTFTVTLWKDLGDGAGFVAAAGEDVDFILTDGDGASSILDAPSSTCDDAGPNTDGSGQCTIVFTSNTAGTTTGHASSTLTVGGLPLFRETDGASPNSDDAVKEWVGEPDIEILKEISVDSGLTWFDANTAGTAPKVSAPSGALYRLTVTNTGDNPLDNVVVNDPTLGIVNYLVGSLAVDEVRVLTQAEIPALNVAERCGGAGTFTNVSDVEGTYVETGAMVTDTDPAVLVCESPPTRFLVRKFYDDGNPLGVAVTLSCDTGLPLEQTKVITDYPTTGDHVEFVIVDFDAGEMDCDIFEVVPDGYSQDYEAGSNGGVADSIYDDVNGCHYDGVQGGDFYCDIYNDLDPVCIEVNKVWFDEHPEFNNPTFAKAFWTCWNTNEQVDRNFFGCPYGGDECGHLWFYGEVDSDQFCFFPHWNGTTVCDVDERLFESDVISDDSECQNLSVAPGMGNECTIYNTRFYEGIPTLNQYGLALLALLMLGIGAVGLRRFV